MYALLFNLFNMENMFAMKITIKQYKNILKCKTSSLENVIKHNFETL